MKTFLARQPIFDINENVYAYEILYRGSYTNAFNGTDGDKASSNVIINTFQTFGINTLSNRKPVFINFTENLICDEIATILPNDLLVVEILENVAPKEGIIEKCRTLKKMGYKIALDDFLNAPGYEPLIELADIIKIDFINTDKKEIENILDDLKSHKLEFLAEKVEQRDEFDYAKRLNFKYFQGYFFSKPELISTKVMLPIKANYLQLIEQINETEVDFNKLANVISNDLSLTYNLLRLVNTTAFGFRYRIKTVKHGLLALGKREIKKWIHLLILNDMGEGRPDELTKLSLIRAKFMELLASKTKHRNISESMFLAGLFSLLDVILQKPLENVLQELKTTEIIQSTLLNEEGEAGGFYKMIKSYEKGEWDKTLTYADKLNINSDFIISSYMDALTWYNTLV